MENLLSALLIIIFLWFVIGMIIPLKAEPHSLRAKDG